MSHGEGRKWIQRYPEVGAGPLDVERYLSTERFELERDRIFKKVWLYVARVEQIPDPGDWIVKNIEGCDASILVIRGQDGVVRAFHNVCTHRCMKLACEEQGGGQGRLVCRYHGWSFDTQGKLRSVPDEAMFYKLSRADHGLVPVALDTWQGFVFINLDPEPQEGLSQFLGEIAEEHGVYPFHGKTQVSYRIHLRCNWKTMIDAFSETYHVPFIHRRSASEMYASKDNPLCQPIDVKLWQRHRRIALAANPGYSPTPVALKAIQFATLTLQGGTIHAVPPGVNLTREPMWGVDLPGLFPNVVMGLFSNSYLLVQVWPLSADECIFEANHFHDPAEDAGQAFSREYSKCVLRDAWLEDAAMMEAVHAAMRSRARSHMVLQDAEIAIRHFHKVIDEHISPA